MALSGQIVTNDYSGRYYTLDWTATQSVANNTSSVVWSLKAVGKPSNWYREYSLKVVIDGQTVVNSTTAIDRWVGEISKGTQVLTHDAQGSRSFSMSIATAVYTDAVNLNASGSFTLNQIQRASTLNPVADFNVEGPFTVSWTPSAAAKSYRLRAYLGTSLMQTFNYVNSGHSYTFAETVITALYNSTPNVKYTTITFQLTTYANNNITGQVGAISTAYGVMSVHLAQPKISHIGVYDTNYKARTIVGQLISGVSIPKVSIVNPEPGRGAQISSYYIYCQDYISANTQEFTAKVLPIRDTFHVGGTITDSRGYSVSSTLTLPLLPYWAPSITEFNPIRTNAEGVPSKDGTFAKIYFTIGAAPLLNKNVFSYSIFTKERGASSWTILHSSSSSYNNQDSVIYNSFSVTKSYDFKIEITDLFNTTISLGNISTGEVTMSWSKSGVGVGKIWERGSLDVKDNIYTEGSIIIKDNLLFDFVNDQGVVSVTDGEWTYRKHKSGQAEVWGKFFYSSINMNIDAFGYKYSELLSIPYPFNFTNAPVAIITGGSRSTINTVRSFGDSASHAKWRVFGLTHPTTVEVYLDVYAHGRWK